MSDRQSNASCRWPASRARLTAFALLAALAFASPARAQPLIDENFDNIGALFTTQGGWFRFNKSSPAGVGVWQQGANFAFPAHIGAFNACISSDFTCGSGVATLSNWLITKPVTLQNDLVLRFYTRTRNPPDLPDRLQVRMSSVAGDPLTDFNITTSTSVGIFTTLLLDINPTYALSGYPSAWTEFIITLSGIPAPTQGRIAFRYFVENGGPAGVRSDIVGLDTVTLSSSPPPNPCELPLPSCAADVAPVGGNNAVDVDDLITVILNWGQNNPTGPRPQGDCAPQPNGDCAVNVDDLIAVILAWGACPTPTGACCITATGQCVDSQTSTQCAAAGGVYQGNNSACAQVNCPQPNNDFCEAAIPVAIGASVNGSLTGATADPFPTCNGVGAASGRWYKVTGNGTTLTASLCGSSGLFDSRLTVYCGTGCKDFVCVNAADNDSCSAHETVSWCAANGQTYWLLVHSANVPSGQGAFTLNVSGGSACGNPIQCVPGPPVNDLCANATIIGNGAIGFTTIGASTDGNPFPPGACDNKKGTQAAADIWFRYTATCTGTLTATTCSQLGGSADFDTKIVVYQLAACPPPDSARIGCNDDDPINPCGANPPFASTATASVVSGQQYLIRLGGFFDDTDVGSGVLNVTCTP